jgi:uncharacterized radical SAM protein YgiQ
LHVNQSAVADVLGEASRIPGVRHLRTASGIRYDLALRDHTYLHSLVSQFTGGQLTVAPEHNADHVLDLMRKPPFKVFMEFLSMFEKESRRAGKEQYVLPYLISAFPGCTDDDMRDLRRWLREHNWKPQQVQCFIPTPGTVATAMYHAGIDPSGSRIHVARTDAERLRQHAILVKRPAGKQPRRNARARPGGGAANGRGRRQRR